MTTKYHPWAKSYRLPQIEPGECGLCEEVRPCFAFLDNEGYCMERLCKECLTEAMRLLEENNG